MMLKLKIVMLLLISIACTSQKNMSSNLDSLIRTELGTNEYMVSHNENGTYMLCYTSHISPQNVYQSIKYLVCDKQSNTIIHKGNIKDGSIKWISNYELEITEIPGLAEDGKTSTDYIKVINVKSYQK
jgi:hypothetical protein